MKAILSSTYDDTYLFFLPMVAWSWNKLGINCINYLPYPETDIEREKMDLVGRFIWDANLGLHNIYFKAPDHKKPTYAQCSRLYAAANISIPDDEVLITGDVDMAVFNEALFNQLSDGNLHVVGADLVPEKQFPMCYIVMPAKTWRDVMWIGGAERTQNKLDQLLGHIECDHFRGNMWAKDQETAYNYIVASGLPVVKHYRAAPGTQFATLRADRDGWPQVISPDIKIIDAHLPRPGYTDENFAKILNLFQTMYPNEGFQWMIDYRNEYLKLINGNL